MTSPPAPMGWTWAQTVALIVPFIAMLGGILIWALNHRAARRERRARAFADALAAIEDYAEMPYRIRRRVDAPEARQELANQISTIQAHLAFHQAWLQLEAPAAAPSYDKLIRVAKAQAGTQMSEAWRQQPITTDSQMNLSNAYPRDQIDEARAHCLSAMRSPLTATASLRNTRA